MENLNLIELLGREVEKDQIINILYEFEKNKKNLMFSRGIYIYGSPGSGKTKFVKQILKSLNYDVICFDAGDIRNKAVIDNITKHKISDNNILSIFQKKKQKILILMDEIDGMNSGDKGGINTLIKLIRPKKTKKQKLEELSMVPIICIGNYHVDKKIKELIKVCSKIEIKKPTNQQVENILTLVMPDIDKTFITNILDYVQGDLRKIELIYKIYKNHPNFLDSGINSMLEIKNYNEDTKIVTRKLLEEKFELKKHIYNINDTDRTSIGLLFHENIIDCFTNIDKKESINLYLKLLDNICYSDYIDRITFQKQIWIFNELSSLIKTINNNNIYHKFIEKKNYNIKVKKETRFTKVLTKYSTEYNNMVFIKNLCMQLNMDKKDMLLYFSHLRQNNNIDEIIELFNNDNYEINKLDINRIYRFLDFSY